MSVGRWRLPAALGCESPGNLVAFVGGGGKTSLMFALAAVLPGRVVVTTTTRIFAAQMRLAPAIEYAADLSRLDQLLEAHGRCLVVGQVEGDKAFGVDPALPAALLARPDVDFVLVEADGSRMRPVKAPAAHEPVIPPGTTLVVPVAGLDALERPLEEVAHRPELVKRITNEEIGIRNEESGSAGARERGNSSEDRQGHYLTAQGLARLLTHPEGGLKGVPEAARVVAFLNKAEGESRLAMGRTAAQLMLREPRLAQVAIATVRAAEPVREVWQRVAAVVLAAGESRRMGHNKLLLPWGDTTVLGQTVANVRATNVHGLLVVTGHERDRVERLFAGPDIQAVHNDNYGQGMLSSVQTAIRALPESVAAALIVLGDQPMVTPAVIDRLLITYAGSPAGLVAPTYDGRRGNPVIIDRRHFAELLDLPAEAAPRALLQRHLDDLLLVPVEVEAVLHDLDRPEQYERWRP